ncbi:hypothetical protein [Actinophytocola sp. KF-1]
MRRTSRLVVAAAGVLAALAATPPLTASAATPPVVNWAHSVEDDLGTLEVAARAEAGVTALRAHIRKYGVDQDIAVVDDFVLVSGTVQDGVWRTPQPVQLAEFDYYDVVVDVTDADGNVASGPSRGTLTYAVRTTFSPLRIDPPAVTYTDREVTVSGTLTGTRPDNREVVPVPGGAVDVSSIAAEGQPATVTTAADGTFAATLVMAGPGDVYAVFGAEGYYMRANSEPTPVEVVPAESRISLRLSATEVDQGAPVTVSGQLTWLSPDNGWQPLAGKQIGVLHCSDSLGYCNTFEYPITDAEGRYSVVMTPWSTGHFRVGYPSDDPFVGRAVAEADIVVWEPASFTDFTAARDAAGDVVAQGHMEFGYTTPWPVEVEIQFQRAGSRTWTTVATDDDAEWDGTGGYLFTATVDQPRKGHWRAYFAGRPDLFRPATSDPVFVR